MRVSWVWIIIVQSVHTRHVITQVVFDSPFSTHSSSGSPFKRRLTTLRGEGRLPDSASASRATPSRLAPSSRPSPRKVVSLLLKGLPDDECVEKGLSNTTWVITCRVWTDCTIIIQTQLTLIFSWNIFFRIKQRRH
jgi:hypothetical protein